MAVTKEQLEVFENKVKNAEDVLRVAKEKDDSKSTADTKKKLAAAEDALLSAQTEFETQSKIYEAVQEALKSAEEEKQKAVQEAVEKTRNDIKSNGSPIVMEESGETYIKLLDKLVSLPRKDRPEFITLETKRILNLITVNFNCLESVDENGKVNVIQKGVGHRCDAFDVPPTRKVKISSKYLDQMGDTWSYRKYLERGELLISPVEG